MFEEKYSSSEGLDHCKYDTENNLMIISISKVALHLQQIRYHGPKDKQSPPSTFALGMAALVFDRQTDVPYRC